MYVLIPDMSQDTELPAPFEEDLVNLLNTVGNDPWSLLMIQTLLWSFRRWAIYYLMSNELTDSMREYVWDSHIDLVRQFAPRELKDFGVIWLNPTNVGERIDLLQDLNSYFLNLVDRIDAAIQSDSPQEQDALSTFLDETLTEIIDQWLEGADAYRIYPRAGDSPDDFPSDRVFQIMQLILDTHIRPALSSLSGATASVPEPVQAPVPEPVSTATAQAPEPAPEPVAATTAPTPEPEVPNVSVQTAIRRRRTLRIHRKEAGKKTRKNRDGGVQNRSSESHA